MNGLYYVGGQSRCLNYASQTCALCICRLVRVHTCDGDWGMQMRDFGDPCLEEMLAKARGTQNTISSLLSVLSCFLPQLCNRKS